MHKIIFDNGEEYTPTKIVAVGLNYSDHAKEMGSKLPAEPLLFFKPTNTICDINKPLQIPKDKGEVHHEVELAICIGTQITKASQEEATRAIVGYGLALDLTLRDKQKASKEKGHPWATSKGFDNSCPLSVFKKVALDQILNANISLTKNGKVCQSSNTSFMIFKPAILISYISHYFTLYPGDIIITGTPSGVGPLQSSDKIEAEISGLISISTVVA